MAICIAHSTMIGSVDLGLGASTNEILSKLFPGSFFLKIYEIKNIKLTDAEKKIQKILSVALLLFETIE